MDNFSFVFNQNICVGCRSCVVACQMRNDLEEGVYYRSVSEYTVAKGKKDAEKFLSTGCNHCEEPACLNVCPVKAYKKLDNGIVYHDRDRCIGCEYCIKVCPYSAITLRDEKTEKCNMCIERLEKGMQTACVEGCPLGALSLSRAEDSRLAKNSVGFSYEFTKPTTRFVGGK